MSGAGSVAWQFSKKGLLLVKKETVNEDKIMTVALDAGASDFSAEKNHYEITTEPHDFENVKKAVVDAQILLESAEVTKIPSATVTLSAVDAKAVLALLESLEEHEDVQNVYSNAEFSDEVLQELGG